jgi:hypothetical protein
VSDKWLVVMLLCLVCVLSLSANEWIATVCICTVVTLLSWLLWPKKV